LEGNYSKWEPSLSYYTGDPGHPEVFCPIFSYNIAHVQGFPSSRRSTLARLANYVWCELHSGIGSYMTWDPGSEQVGIKIQILKIGPEVFVFK
jgi:hypothetical protein